MKKVLVIASFFFLAGVLFGQRSVGIDSLVTERHVDGTGQEMVVIAVPGRPAGSFRMPEAGHIPATSTILPEVPAYYWAFGCSPTAAAMMAGYYDRTGFPNMYAGPAGNGVAPMDNALWGDVVINGDTLAQCPLSATRMGLDGRTARGHVDDYWVSYLHAGPDPYITNGWVQHAYDDCTGDFMKTNQSFYNLVDGATYFDWYWNGAQYSSTSPRDGLYGLKLFFESRGYVVTSYFNQFIYGYNGNTIGFTFAQYKQEIDSGRPVFIQISGHSMLGFGYDDAGNTVYLHDTWDYSTHTMTWGGYYAGHQHFGVGVIRLEPAPVTGSIRGQVRYFNQYETVMPPSANIKVALDDNGVLSQEQFLQYSSGSLQGSYQFDNIVPGVEYGIRLWEAPAGGLVSDTWSWNNWGGVNSQDALIISHMYLGIPSLPGQYPWLTNGAPVPAWTAFFGGLSAGHNYNVANVNNDGMINNLDALLILYRTIGWPGTSPFPGGAFNFQVAGQLITGGATTVYPNAPSQVFNQYGSFLPAYPASGVYYKTTLTGTAGARVFNIYYEATGDVNASYMP